jgi:hypothetical protein
MLDLVIPLFKVTFLIFLLVSVIALIVIKLEAD